MEQNETRLLLQECRQIMTKRLRRSITSMLNEVDETLLKIAQNHSAGMDDADCYEAVREIRLKRVEIKTRFERRFINLFENELLLLKSQAPDGAGAGDEIAVTDVQPAGASEQSAGPLNEQERARQDCGQALLELDRKVALLLNSPKRINPMQPAFVFAAFREACWDINSGDEVKQMMFTIFERHIAEELQGIYEDINKVIDARETRTDPAEVELSRFAGLSRPEQEAMLLHHEVSRRIEDRLRGKEVPEFIRAFLLNHWRLFLEDIYSTYSENSIAWNAARQTMDDLLWAVCKPASLYDRQRQVQLLPSLLFRLLNGMKVIAMNDTELEIFMRQLKQHQLNNLSVDDSGLLDTIAEEAKESVSRNHSRTRH